MPLTALAPVRIGRPQFDWLEAESAAWRDEGLLDDTVRARILQRYDAQAAERRGLLALMIVAVLMCAAGIALLIGYNWHRLPSAGKVTLLVVSVAAAFAASSVAYRKGRETAGELLALAGTLLYGNSIWLIAQVLHIEGRYPDAFLWFAVGALACSYLVKSRWIAVEAAVIAAVWVIAEGTFVLHINLLYIALAPFVLFNAYRTRVPVIIPIVAFSTALWAFFSAVDDSPAIAIGSSALLGCAFHAIGRAHRTHPFGGWWQLSGLGILLLAFIPLLIEGYHRDAVEGRTPDLPALVLGGAIAALCIAIVFLRRPVAPVERVLAATTIVVTAWTMLHLFVLPDFDAAPRMASILFSALALGVGVSLIRAAVHHDRPPDLGIGVLFALVFLIVRWAEAADNLFWSGLFLLITGGGLLLVGRLWQHRDRAARKASVS